MLWRWRRQYEEGELGLISQPELLPLQVEQDISFFEPDLHVARPTLPAGDRIETYIGDAKLVLRGNPEGSLLRKAIEALR